MSDNYPVLPVLPVAEGDYTKSGWPVSQNKIRLCTRGLAELIVRRPLIKQIQLWVIYFPESFLGLTFILC